MIVLTIQDEHHDEQHELLLPDGPIPQEWFPTSSINGHFHGVWIDEPMEVGDTREFTTDLSLGEVTLQRHAHQVVVTATEAEPDQPLAGAEAGSEDEAVDEEGGDERPEQRMALMATMETKVLGGVTEVKTTSRNGVPIGVVAGYLSTWDPDTGGRFGVPDKFERGAWLESLAEHRARGNRQVRLKDHHGRTIGGFPIETVFEDERGLFGVGEVNLVSQCGREAHSLAMQGVLVDFSVGYVALDDKLEETVRRIFRAKLFEASIVDEPGNQRANITEVKAALAAAELAGDRTTIEQAKLLTARELEGKLHQSGKFSRSASRWLAAKLGSGDAPPEPEGGVSYDPKRLAEIHRELKGIGRIIG